MMRGWGAGALVDFSTRGGDGIDLDLFVSIHAQLDEQVPVDLFRVRAEEPSYWRLYSLVMFDGATWTSSNPRAEGNGRVLTTPIVLPVADDIPQEAPRLAQTFTILRDIDNRWLPMAHPAEALTTGFGDVIYDPILSQVLLDGGLDEGLQDAVPSRLGEPPPQEAEE